MTDTTTKADVRRAIAEALGWRVEPCCFEFSNRTGYTLVSRDGKAATRGYNYWTEAEAWLDCPDWPNDPGAALELCLEITTAKGWYITISDFSKALPDDDSPIMVRFYWTGGGNVGYEKSGATPAEALARLALAALKAQVMTDG